MNRLSIINHPDFGEVRNLLIKGEPWFVAKDICEVLGLSKYRDAITGLDDDEKQGCPLLMDTQGGKQTMTIISESGLYSLIMLSRKPQAKAFRKWVTSEVLPSIRRTGYYISPNALLSNRDRNVLLRNFHKELGRNITGEDVFKCSKRFRCTEQRVECVLRGNISDNEIMRDLQDRALQNRSTRIDAYADSHIRKVLDTLK